MERFSIENILFMFKILLTLVEISLKISMENYLEFDKITLSYLETFGKVILKKRNKTLPSSDIHKIYLL